MRVYVIERLSKSGEEWRLTEVFSDRDECYRKLYRLAGAVEATWRMRSAQWSPSTGVQS